MGIEEGNAAEKRKGRCEDGGMAMGGKMIGRCEDV